MSKPIQIDPRESEPKSYYSTELRQLERSKFVELECAVEELPKLCLDLELAYGGGTYPLLFRGQSDQLWKLESTLEREYGLLAVDYYLERATACIHEITSVLGKKAFTDLVPSYQQLDLINAAWDEERSDPKLPCIEYFAYLRHHGFPTPLLDWSRSPFVALFFAMIDRPSRDISKQVNPAIIVLIRDSGQILTEGKPMVKCVGPYITTHPRHYSQETQFTYAIRRLRSKDNPTRAKWFFHNHDSAIEQCDELRILKIVFPSGATERRAAIKMLQSMNITPYTLFGTEDSLIASVALRELDLRNPSDGVINGYEPIEELC